jgi:MFS family permease
MAAAVTRFLDRVRRPLRGAAVAAVDGPFRALRHTDFRRFAAGQGISLVGTWMQTIAQGWLVLDLTHSAFAVGLTTTLGTLPILLLTLYGGVVADRVDRRRFLIVFQAVMLVAAALLAGLTLSGRVTVVWIWVLAALTGIGTAFEVPARQSFVVELVPPEDMISAAAFNSTIYNLTRVIGPAIAGVVVAAAGAGWAFLLNALSYVAALVGFVRIERRDVRLEIVERQSVFTGMRFIRSQPELEALTWEMVVLTVFAGSFVPMLPVYARQAAHVGAQGFGALTSAVGVGASIGAVATAAVGSSIRRTRTAVVCGALLAASVLGLALVTDVGAALAIMAVAGAAMAGQSIATATTLQLASPSALRGRVMAVYSFVVLGLAPVGALQAGWLAERFGIGWAFAIDAMIGLLGTAVLRRRLWHGSEDGC